MAESLGNKMTGIILGLLISGILIAYLLPVALDSIAGVDTSAWSSDVADLWGLFNIFLVLVPLIALIGYVMVVIRD